MTVVKSLRVDHESQMISYYEGAEVVFGCHVDQIGLNKSDGLEGFVVEAGGIKKAVMKMQAKLES